MKKKSDALRKQTSKFISAKGTEAKREKKNSADLEMKGKDIKKQRQQTQQLPTR